MLAISCSLAFFIYIWISGDFVSLLVAASMKVNEEQQQAQIEDRIQDKRLEAGALSTLCCVNDPERY